MARRTDPYFRVAVIMIGLAVIITAVVLVTNRGDLTSATLILVAFACFIAGIFIFFFQREGSIDQKFAAGLGVPYTSTLSRILGDLGVQGHAHFIPVRDDGTFPASVMQFNPVSDIVPERLGEDLTFSVGKHGSGLLTVPSGTPLLAIIERDNMVTLPSSGTDLTEVLREINQDLLEVADKVVVTHSGNDIVVEMKNFRLIDGCIHIQDESPRNCITAPCPVCSLSGIVIAKCLGKTCLMQNVLVDQKAGNIEIRIGVREP